MKSLLRAAVALSVSLSLLGVAASSRAEVVDAIAAVVNGRVITKSDIDRELGMYGSSIADKETRNLALEAIIERYLLEERAKKMRLEVTDRDVNSTIDNIRKQYRLDPLQFREAVTKQGVTWEGYVAGVRNEIQRMRVFGASMGEELRLDDERLKAYYLKNAESFRLQPKVRLLGATTPKGSRQAELIKAKTAQGVDFKTAVKDVTGQEAYDTGMMAEEGLSEAFKVATAALKVGETSNPVDTGAEEHVVFVAEKAPGAILPFEQVKEKVRERFTTEGEQELYKGWMEQQKRKANIQRMP